MQKETIGIHNKKIGVVGMWHLGEIFSAGLAEIGHSVIGFDAAPEVISKLKIGQPPLDEPSLSEMIKRNIALGRLSYTADFSELAECSVVWVAFDTPVVQDDVIDLDLIWNFFENNIISFRQNVLIVISSQLPIGTCGRISSIITAKRPDLAYRLAYVPENLQLGQAIKSFFEPGRVIIGSEDNETIERVKEILAPLSTVFLPMNLSSAELVKHALNAFLATSLSFIYDIADVASAYGADVVEVTKALRSDPRIGPGAYLDASIGFSGGTLARDVQVLLQKGKEAQVVLPVISGVFNKNKNRLGLVVSQLRKHLGNLAGKRVAVLGLTYKPGTATMRRSLAVEIIDQLVKEGVVIKAYDPAASADEIKNILSMRMSPDVYAAAEGCQAVICVTNWPEFKQIDFRELYRRLESPHIFFDTRNFFHEEITRIRSVGFAYIGVGIG